MKDIERLIANIHVDVDTGEDFFKAITDRAPEIQHVELGNGVDAITSRYAEGFSYKEDGPCTSWNLETIEAFAKEFNMEVVALKKHDCDPEWNITDDFDEYDSKGYLRWASVIFCWDDFDEYDSKGLNVMDYCKDIEDAYVSDTVDDVERVYNEYAGNLEEQFAYDDRTLLEELDKAQKGRDKLIEQVKHKDPSEFVMIPAVDFDANDLEIMPKFSTMFYDSFNGISYALGLIFKEQ